MDIKFENLNYFVNEGIFQRTKKSILTNISGHFQRGQLTGILGQSGSGKTSLINCISSYQTKNVHGSIKRSKSDFKTKYIMQEDANFNHLTVLEAMTFSMNFKMLHNPEKINLILKKLGIDHKVKDLIKTLSSGEQRRLSIALELVDDPKVIFLDEPTSGLDSSSSTHCIKLLKMLAIEGRTIICTIHQPSGNILKLFDQIYAMSKGCCIYQGSYENVLKFFKEVEVVCPKNYNPVDYLLEIQNTKPLMDRIDNGKCEEFKGISSNLKIIKSCQNYQPSFQYRLWQLITRTMLLMTRDKSNVVMRVLIHMFVGLLIGILYSKIGNDAEEIFNQFKYIFVLCGFCAYSGFYSLMVKFPLELPFVKREVFNENYSTLIYHLAVFISDVPVTIFCTSLYVSITYFLTDQPIEGFRFFMVIFILNCVSFIAQAYGTFLGAMFEMRMCVIIAALLMATHVLFSGFIILENDVHWIFNFIFEVIYLKHAFYGVTSVIMGFNREDLKCDKIYCHFQKPRKFMDMIGVDDDLLKPLIVFILTFCILHLMTYCRLRYRLKN